MRYTNREVKEAFSRCMPAESLNMTSTGNKLFSYYTVIAQLHEDSVIINHTYYSNTTSHHQSGVSVPGFKVIIVKNVPRGAKDLAQYIA